MRDPELINVTLKSPESVVWQGDATTVTSQNSEGLFDLYPDHARFMTLLEGVDLLVRLPTGEEKKFAIEKAVLLFEDAHAHVYLHTHIDPEPN